MYKVIILIFIQLLVSDIFSQSVIIDSVIIKGNDVTKRSTILRELPVKQGNSISIDSIGFYKQKLAEILLNTSLFNYVTIDFEPSGEYKFKLIIEVEERWYLWPYPIFEQADRNLTSYFYNQQWERLNYGFYLVKYNLFGKRQTLKAKIRLGYKEQYGISFQNPSLHILSPLGVYFDISGFRQKEIYYNTLKNKPLYFADSKNYLKRDLRVLSAVQYRQNWAVTYSLQFNYYQSLANDSIIRLNPQYQFGNRSISCGFGATFQCDKRDIKVYPLRGYRIEVSPGIQWYQNEPSGVVSGKSGIYFQLSQRWFASSAFYGFYIDKTDLPFFYKLMIGNDLYIRGYELYLITGNACSIVKNSIKFNLVKQRIFYVDELNIRQFNKIHYALYLNIFSDAGYINSSLTTADIYNNKFLYSIGCGIDLVTYYDKILRLDYTLNNFGKYSLNIHIYSEL